jgi:hypothetical protein
MVRIAGGVATLLAVVVLVNIVYHVIRKPAELFVFVGNSLDKEPSENWRQYAPPFRVHSILEPIRVSAVLLLVLPVGRSSVLPRAAQRRSRLGDGCATRNLEE